MMSTQQDFLKNEFINLIKSIPTDTSPKWGKMSFQQMVEHFVDVMKIASGKTAFPEILTPEDRLEKMRAFMMSNKPFQENTKNPLLPETPAPVRSVSPEAAITELEKEIRFFFSVFENNNLHITRNPLFGDLTYDENLHLLYKHAWHHLRQFGIGMEGIKN